MAESPAINTSPLIFLSKANLLNLLQIVSPQIIVPEAVAIEIQAYGETDVTAQTLAATDWLVVTPMPPVPAVIQSWDLGAGESAVLTWSYTHPGTEIILDDASGSSLRHYFRHSNPRNVGVSPYRQTTGRDFHCPSSFRTTAPVRNVSI